MRISLFLLMLSVVAAMASAQTVRGDKSIGVTAGYASHNKSASAGLSFDYAFSRYVVVAPSVDIVFPHHGASAGLFNFDLRVPLRFSSPATVEFFPIVGVNFNSWKYTSHDTDPMTGDTTSWRSSHLGLNLGAGLQWRIKPTLKVYFQARYTSTPDNPNTLLLLGISRVF